MAVKPYKIPHPFRKLTTKLIDILVKDIADGSTHRYAAESNGITETIFNIWRQQGKVDIDHGQEDTLPAYLVGSLANVKAKEIKECRQRVRESDKGHKGAEWTLEHAYWREFGPNAPIMELADEIEKLKNSKNGVDEGGDNNSKEKKDSEK